jgi:uncharacterized membrane protein
MNTFTSITRAALGFTLTAALVITSGCATIDSTTTKLGDAVGIKSDSTASTVTGGAIGCGAGALIGHFLHKSALAGCAVGGAAGAIAATEIHKHQVEQARELAAQARAAGAVAVLKMKTVQAKDASGQMKPAEAVDSLTIDLKESDVKAHGQATRDLIAKADHMAEASAPTDPVTITVRGTTAERAWLMAQVRQSLSTDTKVTVHEAPAKAPALVLSPVPNVAG